MKRLLTGIFIAFLGLGVAAGPVRAEEKLLPEPTVNDEGLHTQPWFLVSFLDLREDIRESAKEGKQIVVLWEQRGCPYCREMHQVNLRIPEIVDYIKANFNVVQLNLWGDREVTDVDGQVMTEKKLARKHRVQFTPTLQFFPLKIDESALKAGEAAEVWRVLGYWKPFHFLNSFVYVKERGYETEPNFQRWLQVRADRLRAEGKEVKLW